MVSDNGSFAREANFAINLCIRMKKENNYIQKKLPHTTLMQNHPLKSDV